MIAIGSDQSLSKLAEEELLRSREAVPSRGRELARHDRGARSDGALRLRVAFLRAGARLQPRGTGRRLADQPRPSSIRRPARERRIAPGRDEAGARPWSNSACATSAEPGSSSKGRRPRCSMKTAPAELDFDELPRHQRAAHAAYARAFRSWRSYTPGTNMRAWLLRILTNINIDRAGASSGDRPSARWRRATTPSTTASSRWPATARAATRNGCCSDSLNQTSSMPWQRCRMTSATCWFSSIWASSATRRQSQILSIPIGTVMSRLHRARRLLRQSLASSLEGER